MRAVATELRRPVASFLARVHSELQTALSTPDGIHPARASRKTNGTAEPTRPPGHAASVDRSARGRLTAAASSVDNASSSTMTLMERSRPRNRPHHSSAATGVMTAAASTGSAQSRPRLKPRR